MASKDIPKSGRGSESDRLSDSPLSIRRGGADPTDVHPDLVQTNTGQFHDYDNQMKPTPPIEEMGSK